MTESFMHGLYYLTVWTWLSYLCHDPGFCCLISCFIWNRALLCLILLFSCSCVLLPFSQCFSISVSLCRCCVFPAVFPPVSPNTLPWYVSDFCSPCFFTDLYFVFDVLCVAFFVTLDLVKFFFVCLFVFFLVPFGFLCISAIWTESGGAYGWVAGQCFPCSC